MDSEELSPEQLQEKGELEVEAYYDKGGNY